MSWQEIITLVSEMSFFSNSKSVGKRSNETDFPNTLEQNSRVATWKMVSPMHGMERAAVGEVTLLFFLPASLASRKSVLFEKSSCINLQDIYSCFSSFASQFKKDMLAHSTCTAKSICFLKGQCHEKSC